MELSTSTALVVGASTGIGRAIAARLIARGWTVIGVARRASTLVDPRYRHVLGDVADPGYRALLEDTISEVPVDVCIYAAGIGTPIDLTTLAGETAVFATNLVGLVTTAEVVLPPMIARGRGHLVGLSSQADRMIDGEHPSYAASKAGMSSYLEGLAFACRPRGVAITNLRFGFVDTAMSSSAHVRPFLITADRAAAVIERCLRRRPIRATYPWRMEALLWFVRWPRRVRLWLT